MGFGCAKTGICMTTGDMLLAVVIGLVLAIILILALNDK